MARNFFDGGQDYETRPVPLEGRVSMGDVTLVLGGYMATVTTFMLGMTIGMNMVFSQFITMLMGSLVILMGTDILSSMVSYRTGLTWALLSRHIFGEKAGLIPALLVGILYTGWLAFDFSWVPEYTREVWGWPFITMTIVFTLIFSTSAYIGFNAIKWVSRIAVPSFILWSLWLIYASAQHKGLGFIVNYIPENPMTLSTGLAAIIGQWVLTSVAGTCDINRFAVDLKAAIWSAVWSHIFRVLLIISGFFTAVAFNSANPGMVMTHFGPIGIVVGFILLFALMWTTADNSIYASSIAISGTLTRLTKRQWVLIIVPLSLLAAIFRIMDHFVPWLLLISIVVPTLPGIMIAEFYILPKLGYRENIWDVFRNKVALHSAPFIAFILGSIISYFLRDIQFSEFMIIGIAAVLDAVLVTMLEPKPKSTGMNYSR